MCLPNAAVGHRAGNPAHAAVPPAVRLAITTVPENAPTPGNQKIPQNPSPNFPNNFP
jgi:hypothetical protein